MKNKKAQEEMVGFALIIILIAVIFVAFLGFSLRERQTEKIESKEVIKFMAAVLGVSVKCGDYDLKSIEDLISECNKGKYCSGQDSCKVLEASLQEILNSSWNLQEQSPVKGYSLNITKVQDKTPLVEISAGNVTRQAKWTYQDYAKERVEFVLYYKP